jgi:hypothetical protein
VQQDGPVNLSSRTRSPSEGARHAHATRHAPRTPRRSPEAREREVTERMEQAFSPVEGVDRITSVSLEGVSQVTVEFELSRRADLGAQDIRSKIDSRRPPAT